MKLLFPEVKAKFIVDNEGNKKQIVLDIEQFEELMETLEDFYDIARAALAKNKDDEEVISLEEMKKDLLKN